MSIHSDHFATNSAYSVAAYVKGEVFLTQLDYILGEADFDRGMLEYYFRWRFQHPNANDFIRVMEKQSGLELDWFKEYFVYTTKTIDYGIGEVADAGAGQTRLTLEKIGAMPMPLDVLVTYADGSTELFNIPLRIMRGHKPAPIRYGDSAFTVLEDWPWTHPTYETMLDRPLDEIVSIEIDPSGRLADTDRENNRYRQE